MNGRRIRRTTRNRACLLGLLALACARRSGSTAPEADARPTPTPSPPAEPEPAAPVMTTEEIVERDVAELVDAFCFDRALETTMPSHTPHREFDAPDGTPHPTADEWDLGHGIQLASCDEIDATVLETWTTDDTVAALIELEADVENDEGYGPGVIATEEYLVVHEGPTRTIHRLTDYIPPFDEAPDVGCELDEAQLRDVAFGPRPEWIAIRTHDVGDCYECDFCWAQEARYRRLVICTQDAPRPGCIEIPLEEVHHYTPREDDEDCDEQDLESASDEEPYSMGFTQTYSLPGYGILRLEGEERSNNPMIESMPLGNHDLQRLFDDPDRGPGPDDRSLHGH